MRKLIPPIPKFHSQQTTYVPSNLASTGYVYVRVDSHRSPLQRPYEGPYRIIDTKDKYFIVDMKGRVEKISIDRLKAAYVSHPYASCTRAKEPDSATKSKPECTYNTKGSNPTPVTVTVVPTKRPTTTRSGRKTQLPLRLRWTNHVSCLGGGTVVCRFCITRHFDEILLGDCLLPFRYSSRLSLGLFTLNQSTIPSLRY